MEVEYRPYTKLLVLDYTQHKSPESIVQKITSGGNVSPLAWCDGIVFVAHASCLHSEGEAIHKLLLSGVKPIEHCDWALMPQHAPVVKFNGIECPVIVSGDEDDVCLAKWLKTKIRREE